MKRKQKHKYTAMNPIPQAEKEVGVDECGTK
jgi:hypothetical protein